MIDCNVTENYLKELSRMHNGGCNMIVPIGINGANIKHLIAETQQWSDAHPIKTYLSDFMEKYPNAKLDENKSPYACMCHLYGNKCPKINCVKCWNRPLE